MGHDLESMPNFGAMFADAAGQAEEARQEAEKAAAWRVELLAEARRHTALLEALTGAMGRLETKLEGMTPAGAMASVFRRSPAGKGPGGEAPLREHR